jgi:hypothetical protein
LGIFLTIVGFLSGVHIMQLLAFGGKVSDFNTAAYETYQQKNIYFFHKTGVLF